MSKRHYLDLGPTAPLKLIPVSDDTMKRAAQLRAREQRWATQPIVLTTRTGTFTWWQRIKRWWRNP